MSKTNKEICKNYLYSDDENVVFNDKIDDSDEKNFGLYDIVEYRDEVYKVPKINEYLLNFYMKNESFDIEDSYLGVHFKIKKHDYFTFVFMEQYVVERDQTLTRLKIFIE